MKSSEIKIFETNEGKTLIEVKLEKETVWISQKQMVELFGRDKSVISRHINNIYKEEELEKDSTVAIYATVQTEGIYEKTRPIKHYNLDVIISVGYRVKSKQGIQFRKWATTLIKDYFIKGYVINQEKLKKDNKQLQDVIDNLQHQIHETQTKLTDGLLTIISHYSKSFELLNNYDLVQL